MAHQTPSSSSSHQVGCPSDEYPEHYLWDYQYEAFPLATVNDTLGSAEQLPNIGQEFDASWDFEVEAGGLNMIANVATAETVSVREIHTAAVVKEHRPSKRLWNFEMISKCFHLPMNEAAKELKLNEATLRKICNKVGIGRWPYKKLRSLERLARKVQGNIDHNEMVNALDMQREHILMDSNLKSDIGTDKLRVSYSKKRKYRNLTELSYSAPLVSSSYVTVDPHPKSEEEKVLPTCT